jgi:hypothetical protein
MGNVVILFADRDRESTKNRGLTRSTSVNSTWMRAQM